MDSSYDVVWSEEALRDLKSILQYLASEWSSQEADQLLNKLHERETLLSYQPKAFPLIEGGKQFRQSVLSSHTTIYYKFENNRVKIYYLFNTHQDPNKLDLN